MHTINIIHRDINLQYCFFIVHWKWTCIVRTATLSINCNTTPTYWHRRQINDQTKQDNPQFGNQPNQEMDYFISEPDKKANIVASTKTPEELTVNTVIFFQALMISKAHLPCMSKMT